MWEGKSPFSVWGMNRSVRGSGFPYCGYLEPEDFFGTDFADYTDFLVWGQG